MSNRAVYIPPAKRKQHGQQPRFHGAFTGGFSAGHFNTVGTRDGWKPSTEQRREQTLEDFMDEQDVHEWGGPTSLRQDFNDQSNERERSATAAAPLDSLLLAPRPLTVGPRLLRHLGWREWNGAAFVPTTTPQDAGTNDDPSHIHLSKRKLRQIELQTSRVKILPPKLDRCGLGFEALDKAPEFLRYRQQRQEVARARARGQSNVYRVSNVTGDSGGDGGEKPSSRVQEIEGGEYLSYETPEDFVGTRTSSGFALRDDDDDAYDPTTLAGDRNVAKAVRKSQLLSQDYHDEVVDIEVDSDVEEEDRDIASKRPRKSFTQATKHVNAVLGGALASWAGKNEPINSKDDAQDVSGSLTCSGRPPLPGFRLGGSMESHKKRYPGPDLPRDYQLKRHLFGPNERPAILQTIGRAMQLEGEQRARDVRKTERQQPREIKRSEQPVLGGNHFATLATAMKNRFTSATEKSTLGTDHAPTAGLYLPPRIQNKNDTELYSKDLGSIANVISVIRSAQPFTPVPLLCKRFGVPAFRQTPRPSDSETGGRVTEASYFENDVLATVRDAAATGLPAGPASNRKVLPAIDEDEAGVEPMVQIPRPSKEELKAIFEPDSDGASSSSADTDLDSLDGEKSFAQHTRALAGDAEIADDNGVMIQYEAQNLVSGVKSNEDRNRNDEDSSARSSSPSRESKHRRSHKKRKKHRKKKTSKRSSRHDDESSNDDLGGGRGRRRRDPGHRKDSKKRRKRTKTSHTT
jgi:G patch domain-containing protein 1